MELDPSLPFGSTQKTFQRAWLKIRYLNLFKCARAIDSVLAPSAM
jgi:hypothetical protein